MGIDGVEGVRRERKGEGQGSERGDGSGSRRRSGPCLDERIESRWKSLQRPSRGHRLHSGTLETKLLPRRSHDALVVDAVALLYVHLSPRNPRLQLPSPSAVLVAPAGESRIRAIGSLRYRHRLRRDLVT